MDASSSRGRRRDRHRRRPHQANGNAGVQASRGESTAASASGSRRRSRGQSRPASSTPPVTPNANHAKPTSSPGAFASPMRSLMPLFVMLKKEFRHQHDMRNFVLAALTDPDPDEVARVLGGDDGVALNKLREIVQSPFSVDAGDRRATYSFQRVALPLCHLLTSAQFENSVHVSRVKRVFAAIAGERCFLPCVVKCLEKMAQRRSIADVSKPFSPAQSSLEWSPKSWAGDVLLPVCKLLLMLLTRVADGVADDVAPDVLCRLEGCLRTWDDGDAVSDEARHCLKRASTLIHKATSLQRGHDRRLQMRRMFVSTKGSTHARRSVHNAVEEVRVEGPGHTRVAGPRHDNDDEDFRRISIVPTSDEILCDVVSYLPKHGVIREHTNSPLQHYLDTQFRLLREDMLAPLQEALQAFIDQDPLSKMPSDSCHVRLQTKRQQDSIVRLDIFRRAQVVALVPSLFRGVCVRVKFDQVSEVAKDTARNQEKYWGRLRGSKLLQSQSLVCLALPGEVLGTFEFCFGVVSKRNEKEMCGKQCSIEIQMVSIGSNKLVELLARSQNRLRWRDRQHKPAKPGDNQRDPSEIVLLQVRGHFFASYQSVLGALQSHSELSVPFQDILLADINESSGGTASSSSSALNPASYINTETRFDLTCLAAPHASLHAVQILSSVPIADFGLLQDMLMNLKDHIVLDDTQSKAFALAMSRKVSLIQGPPGTGKTYVGVRIVQALIANSKNRNVSTWDLDQLRAQGGPAPVDAMPRPCILPILCICYTNHALDQFLENLLDSGMPAEKMIRVGGRSNSERLAARNLKELCRESQTKQERYTMFQLKKKAEVLEAEIDQVLQTLLTPEKHILQWLELMYPDHSKTLTGFGVDEDGFERVYNRGKLNNWEFWFQGHDLRDWDDDNDDSMESERADRNDATAGISVSGPGLYDVLAEGDHDRGDQQNVRPFDHHPLVEEVHAVEAEHFASDEYASTDVGDDFDRPLVSLLSDDKLFCMSLNERKCLAQHWVESMSSMYQDRLDSLVQQYEGIREERSELDLSAKRRILSSSSILGFTTSGCASNQKLLQALGAPIIICEEAGEVFESHVVAALTARTQQLILIGDHQQLRPKTNCHSLSRDSANGHDLDVSMFERLISHFSQKSKTDSGARSQQGFLSFDSIRSFFSPDDHTSASLRYDDVLVTILTQRRMRPVVSEILRRTLYPRLRDSPSVSEYANVRGIAKNLWFFDHSNVESKEGGTSYTNNFEADMVVRLVRYVVRQGYEPAQIAVITPYVGQLLRLRELLSKASMTLFFCEGDIEEIEELQEYASDQDDEKSDIRSVSSSDKSHSPSGPQKVPLRDRVRLATVDNFQGEEAEIVIISTVRNNSIGRTGFLKISNRVNVMLSRAKHGMYILGSSATISRCRTATMFGRAVDYLREIAAIGPSIELVCERHRRSTFISCPRDMDMNVPDGGCSLPCSGRLLCGHACRRLCHPDDIKHQLSMCAERCSKVLPCSHQCSRLCSEECGKCSVLVDFPLACGHTKKVICDIATNSPEDVTCTVSVQSCQNLPCGHLPPKIPCAQLHQVEWNSVNDLIDRGRSDAVFRCTKPCGQVLPCGHPCQRRCGDCLFTTIGSITDSENKGSPILPFKTHAGVCKSECGRRLLCGHDCEATCCKQGHCPPCKKVCSTRCAHSSCERPCSEPCPMCAHMCGWICSHQGACPLPCGSPCIRSPCDRRCEKVLSECGHRCPSVCGEICPSSQYCRECAAAGSDDSVEGNKAALIVDLIMFVRLDQHDPDDSPLLVLPCEHAYTMETLDCQLSLKSVYMQNDERRWCGIRPVDVSAMAGSIQCPECRTPIRNLRRYGRIVNAVELASSQRKYLAKMGAGSAAVSKKLLPISKRIESIKSKDASKKRILFDIMKKNGPLCKLTMFVDGLVHEAMNKSPTKRVYELERAFWVNERRLRASELPMQLIPPSEQGPVLVLRAAVEVHLAVLRCQSLLLHLAVSDVWKRAIESLNRCVELCDVLDHVCESSQMIRSGLDARLLRISVLIVKIRLGLAFEDMKDAPRAVDKNVAKLSLRATGYTEAKQALREFPSANVSSQQSERLALLAKAVELENQKISQAELKMVFEVMSSDVGTGVGSFGGHWFTCPNGHVYTIGECGGAMEVSQCNECGAQIGGQSHRLNSSNAPASEFLAQVGAHQQVPVPEWRQEAIRVFDIPAVDR